MGHVLASVLPLAVFLAIYALLRERSARKSGVRPPIAWRGLAAIAACAAIAALAGLVL